MDESAATVIAKYAPAILTRSASETVFWTGAGISADLPTSAPVGFALTDRTLGLCFAGATLDDLQRYYASLRMARSRPRLETVLDVVRQVHGVHVLADLLSDLRCPPPNGLHQFFATHLLAGGRHITANFDPCIEAAASGTGLPVIHFHGSFADDPGGDSLGATLARIERGFPADIAASMTEALTATFPLALIFVGYSGSDFFDADPYLEAFAQRTSLRGAVVLWIDHKETPPKILSGADAARARPQLSWLHHSGAEVHQITAPTRSVLATLAAAWRLTPPARPSGTPHPWQPTISIQPKAREQATLELFALMGLHREVNSILACRGGPTTQREWMAAAQAAWAEGKYSAAGEAWRQAYPGSDTASWAARTERQAACQWIRGQYRRAYRTLHDALERTDTFSARQLSSESRIQMAETLGRVLIHMRRSADTRLLATPQRRAFALRHLPDPEIPADQPRLGTHLAQRVRSVRADLGAPTPTDGQWRSSQAAFTEYEALNARLNYRHAELRHAAYTKSVDPQFFRHLRDDFLTLGAVGDAARVPLIPGAERAFTVGETLRGLREIDVTWWHRCRLIGGYLVKRAARRHQP